MASAMGIGRRVLIVEDEMLVSMLLEDLLSELGYEVVATAGRLRDASARIDEGAFDFAVIDLNLGGEEAYPLAEQLAARGRPFLFSTGYGAAGTRNEWKHVPALTKPYQRPALEEAIAAMAGLAKNCQ